VEFGSDDAAFTDPGTGERRTIQERAIVENDGYFSALLTGNGGERRDLTSSADLWAFHLR
jgi:hypothetical protein